MIVNQNKYRNFLKILSTIGIFVFTYNYNSISVSENEKNSFSSTSYSHKIRSLITFEEKHRNVKKKKKINQHDLFIKIAKDNAPYEIENINVESIEDDFGILHTINVYMKLPNNYDDDLIVSSSEKSTNIINSDEYLVVYL